MSRATKSHSLLFLALATFLSSKTTGAESQNCGPKEGDALLVIDVQNDFMAETPLDQNHKYCNNNEPSYELPASALTNDGQTIKAGSLAVSNTVEIIQDINTLIANFSSQKLPVFFSLDWHESTHCSFGFNGTVESNPGYFNPNGAFAGPLVEGKTTEADYPGLKDLCLDQRTQSDFRNTNLGVMQWPKHCVQQTFGSRFYPFLKVPKDAQVIKKGVEISKDAYSAFDGFLSNQSFPFDTEDAAVDLTSRSSLETLLRNKRVERLYIVGIAVACYAYMHVSHYPFRHD
jgi:nicotinamidase-related amidase